MFKPKPMDTKEAHTSSKIKSLQKRSMSRRLRTTKMLHYDDMFCRHRAFANGAISLTDITDGIWMISNNELLRKAFLHQVKLKPPMTAYLQEWELLI